jgi:hypothetical protein
MDATLPYQMRIECLNRRVQENGGVVEWWSGEA